MNRPAADQDTTTSNIDKVVEVALETFARQGFEDTRLENIAQATTANCLRLFNKICTAA